MEGPEWSLRSLGKGSCSGRRKESLCPGDRLLHRGSYALLGFQPGWATQDRLA
jgi:hypothetical protein